MATKQKDTSHGKEKLGTHIDTSHGKTPRTPKSSLPTSPDKVHGAVSEKPTPNYLKHTLSSSKEPVCKLQHGKKPVSNDSSPRFSRRKSFDKPPSPAKLQRTLSSNSSREKTPIKPSSPSPKPSISPKTVSPISSKPVSTISSKQSSEKISISPRTISDRTSKTTPRIVKTVQPVSTKPKPLKRTLSNTSSKNEIKASPSPSIASSTAPTSPETVETPSVFEVEQEDKVVLEQEVLEQEILKVEEEEEIPFEIPPEQDQVLVDHVDYESPLKNLEIEKPKTSHTPTLLEEQEPVELIPPTLHIEVTEEKTIEPVENQNQQEDEEEQVMIINEDKKDIEEVSEKQYESNMVSESQDKLEAEAKAEVEGENETTVKPIIREERTGTTGESSEENKPYKMKFQPGKELEVEVEDEGPQKLKFKEREVVQDLKGKKESQAYNDVIEETASKLLQKRKSKVLALAGAFETVISLQEPEGQ
ncbi:Calmodulin-binding domain [Macleaya cordata]|uniref:Calmodulin-binding domain n=1 Tax=Macleaya cordata TaxID=56857 RepID=A0A200PRT9_MACCD|nr:Calmodulin-binding domain [Macleaya cordata]